MVEIELYNFCIFVSSYVWIARKNLHIAIIVFFYEFGMNIEKFSKINNIHPCNSFLSCIMY